MKGCGLVAFNPVFVLLPTEEDLVLKEKGCKRYMFVVLSSGRFEIVFTLLTEVVAFHAKVSIVQV